MYFRLFVKLNKLKKMATELKGLNYFPVDIRFFQCDKIAIIEAEYGLKALAIVFKLLCRIYSEGFYMAWDERACKLFRLNACAECSAEELQAIVGALVKEGFFSAACFEKYGVLTSKGIQRRFFEAASRRKRMVIEREELLLIEPVAGWKKNGTAASASSSCDLAPHLVPLPDSDLALLPEEGLLPEGTSASAPPPPAGPAANEDTLSRVPDPAAGSAGGFPRAGFPSPCEKTNADISGKNVPISFQRRGKEKRETKRTLDVPVSPSSSSGQAGARNDKEKTAAGPIAPPEVFPGKGPDIPGTGLDTHANPANIHHARPEALFGTPTDPHGTGPDTAANPANIHHARPEAPLGTPPNSPGTPAPFGNTCRRWREILLGDEDWLASIVRISGKGGPILTELPAAMSLFEDHITTIGERYTLAAPSDYARRFVSWWRCLHFRPAQAIASPASRPQPAKPSPRPATGSPTAATFTPPAGSSPASSFTFPAVPTPALAADAGSRAERALQTSDAAAGIALQLIGQS